MPTYQNYNSKFISKENLNKNRILTMSNNRKCNYLIVDTSATTGNNKDITTMMGINTQGNTKDILVLKTFVGKSVQELVNEAYWLCCEFNVQIVLADRNGLGINFVDLLEASINPNIIQIKTLDGGKINQTIDINDIINDIKYGKLRFLQYSELARNTYIKPFLGYSSIMEFHNETDKLINEIANIKIDYMPNRSIKFNMADESIGKSRVACLLAYYSYLMSCIKSKDDKNKEKQYYITKGMSQYHIALGTFYKYMFKCIEKGNLNILFYYENKNKIKQFESMSEEKEFKEIFNEYITRIIISRDNFEIRFNNGSKIKFVYAGDSARGYKYHYAVVDSNIKEETFFNVIKPRGIPFDLCKNEISNIDFIEM